MSDLSHSSRESGHPEIARQLEAKLQESAEAAEAQAAEKSAPPKAPEQEMGEGLLGALNDSVSKWHSL